MVHHSFQESREHATENRLMRADKIGRTRTLTLTFLIFSLCSLGTATAQNLLQLLLWRALRKPARNQPQPWDWRTAARTILVVLAYAASDEFHQAFVPSRQASILDVLLDTTGALFALLLLWAIGRWRKRSSSPS